MKISTKIFILPVLILFVHTSSAQLSGSHTVGGSSPDFPTLDSAFNYMELNGVSGAVRLNVRQGTYTLRTTISTISGASSSNSIQVAPDKNNSNPVIFKNRISATTDNFLINIKQGYIRFDSLDFRLDSSSKLGRIIDITATSPNITFNSCIFYGKDSTSTATNFATIYDATTIAAINLKILNCTFHNGAFSIYHAAQTSARETGFEFKNNKVNNFYNQGVYMSYQTQPLVQGNYLIDINKYTAADGIYFSSCDSLTAKENQVYLNGGTGAGIYLTACNGSVYSPNLIVNNFVSIYDNGKSAATNGIYVTTGRYTYLYYNSIYNLSQSSTSRGMYLLQSTSGQNSQAKNNNIVNAGGGYAIYLSSLTGIGAMDYNNYYAASGNLGYLTSARTSLSAWQSATSMEANSINNNVSFTSAYDLHTSSAVLNGKATPVSGITADIDGQTRHSSTPDIGADEFTPNSVDAGLIFLKDYYCKGTQDVMVKLKNQGSDTIKTVKVLWLVSVNGGSFSAQTTYNYSGKLRSGADTLVKIGSYSFSNGNTYKIKAFTSGPNNVTDGTPGNDTLLTGTIMTSLDGTYTIGGPSSSSPDFPNIDSAFNTLERQGVCGPVRLNLRSGTYNEQVIIGNIPGTSSSNTISLGPDPSNNTKAEITYTASATTDNFVINFKNVSYVIIDSITIRAKGTTYGRAVVFEGINSNLSLLGDSIIGPTVTGTSNNLAVVFDNTTAANKNNYLTIKDCKIMNGSYGIYSYGVSQTDMETGNRILNNSITGFYYYGIYSYYQSNNEISGNYVKDNNTYTSPVGLNIYYNDTMSVTNNQVFIGGTSAPDGINWYYSDGSITKPSILANNVVTMYGSATGVANGLTAYEGTYNKVVYNSVNMLGGSSTSRAFYSVYTTLDSAEIFNNNFAHSSIGYAAYFGTSTGINKSNYNNYYTNGSALAYHTATARNTLNDLQAASGLETNSVSADPKFLGAFNLKPRQSAIEGRALPLTYITKDITGANRNTSKPDIGAYEFDKILNDVELVKLITSNIPECGVDSTQISLVIKNLGTNPQVNFNINLTISDSTISYNLSGTLKDTLKTEESDTIYFPKFNTSDGGTFSFKAFTSLSADQDRKNDTITLQRNINSQTTKPDAKTDTICENSPHLLTTTRPPGSFLRWYDAKTGGKLIVESNAHTVNKLKSDTTFYVSAVSSNLTYGDLSTIGTVNNGCGGGVMFDITPKKDISIDSFQHFSSVSSGQIVIMIKSGTSIGFETSPGAWTAVDSTSYVSGSTTIPFIFKLNKPLVLKKDTTYGIYLNAYARYTSQASTPYSNNDLTLTTGSGLCSKFGGVNAGRAFSGKVYYQAGKECESERVPYSLKITPLPKIYLGKDTAYCANSGITYNLDAGPGRDSYSWSTSETTQIITITNEGIYAVDIIDSNGCSNSDDIEIKKNLNPVVNIGNDTAYCAGTGINYTINAGAGYKTYKWNDASTGQTMNISTVGVYSIIVTNNVNCEAMDTLNVIENKDPVVKFGNDTTYCANEGINLLLDAGAGYTTYDWRDTASTQSITVTSTGVYSVIVTDVNSCQGGDTIFVVERSNPKVDLGLDLEYCANSGIIKTLDAGPGFAYKWSTGATTQTINITGPGKYSAEIRDNNNCPDWDTMMVTANPNPIVNIGPDRILNPDLGINEILDAGAGHKTYKWSNGHIFQQITVNAAGAYWVEVSNEKGCLAWDTIVVRFWIPGSSGTLKNTSIMVFPNPANNRLNIISKNSTIETILVYSATGQEIYKQTPKASEAGINTENWANGVYTIAVVSDGKTSTMRVVINH